MQQYVSTTRVLNSVASFGGLLRPKQCSMVVGFGAVFLAMLVRPFGPHVRSVMWKGILSCLIRMTAARKFSGDFELSGGLVRPDRVIIRGIIFYGLVKL